MSSSSIRSCVSFCNVEIREHEVQLGDNPSVSAGLPLTLGWKVVRSSIHDVDEYESNRLGSRLGRRKMSKDERSSILQDCGYSMEEFAMIAVEIQKIKEQRSESARDWDWSFSLQRRRLIRAVLKNASNDLEFIVPTSTNKLPPHPAIGCNGLKSLISPMDVPISPYHDSSGAFNRMNRSPSLTRLGIR